MTDETSKNTMAAKNMVNKATEPSPPTKEIAAKGKERVSPEEILSPTTSASASESSSASEQPSPVGGAIELVNTKFYKHVFCGEYNKDLPKALHEVKYTFPDSTENDQAKKT